VARTGRGGFEAADDHCLGFFPTPRQAAAAITMARPWVSRMTYSPELSSGFDDPLLVSEQMPA